MSRLLSQDTGDAAKSRAASGIPNSNLLSAICYLLSHSSPACRTRMTGDVRVRHGIKMGLAGLVALFCTQVFRLPHDNWAILTVVVFMSAGFVGWVAFKSMMRVMRTIDGALRGNWL